MAFIAAFVTRNNPALLGRGTFRLRTCLVRSCMTFFFEISSRAEIQEGSSLCSVSRMKMLSIMCDWCYVPCPLHLRTTVQVFYRYTAVFTTSASGYGTLATHTLVHNSTCSSHRPPPPPPLPSLASAKWSPLTPSSTIVISGFLDVLNGIHHLPPPPPQHVCPPPPLSGDKGF